jgi:aspartyl-tRNA synthetase
VNFQKVRNKLDFQKLIFVATFKLMINMVDLDYIGTLRKTHFSKDLSPKMENQEVVVGGWVVRTRKMGGLCFVVLQDKFGNIQITAKKGVVSDDLFEKINKVGAQWCLLIKGKIKPFNKAPQGVEIIPSELLIMNTAIEQLPIDMTGVNMSELDTRLNNRTLDLRHPRNQAVFHIHSWMLKGIREYLDSQNFTEIVTPKIIGSATEGGTELFPIMYFEKEAYLTQSAQLYKERLSSVYENVYELAPCYRAEKSFTNRHLCEIYVLDIEMAFANYLDVMSAIEGIIHHTTKRIKENCEEDLKILGVWEKFDVPDMPFPKYTYDEIRDMLKTKCNIKLEFGEDIPTEAYRELDKILPGYYFIIKWPMSVKPFYIQYDREDPKLSESFDLQKGWLELTSGGTRVHDKELLVKNLKEKGLNPVSFASHLTSFDFGMPPHAGMGLGIARWLQVMCNLDQVKEAVMFPRTPDRLDP